MAVTHYIVCRSRAGWAVSANSDLISQHEDRSEAIGVARQLTADAKTRGEEAVCVDLSEKDDLLFETLWETIVPKSRRG